MYLFLTCTFICHITFYSYFFSYMLVFSYFWLVVLLFQIISFTLYHFSLLLVLWPVGSCFARAVSMLKKCKTLISVISFYLYPLLIFLGVFYVDLTFSSYNPVFNCNKNVSGVPVEYLLLMT